MLKALAAAPWIPVDEKLKIAMSPGLGLRETLPDLSISASAAGVYVKLGKFRPASLATTSMKAPLQGAESYPTLCPNAFRPRSSEWYPMYFLAVARKSSSFAAAIFFMLESYHTVRSFETP